MDHLEGVTPMLNDWFGYSSSVLECFWYEIMMKYERGESEELLVCLKLVEEELNKRSATA